MRWESGIGADDIIVDKYVFVNDDGNGDGNSYPEIAFNYFDYLYFQAGPNETDIKPLYIVYKFENEPYYANTNG